MVINKENKCVKFISCTGKYPNLCDGTLTLKINDETVVFSTYPKEKEYKLPLSPGGYLDFENFTCHQGEWTLDASLLPSKFKDFAEEIDEVINKNIPHGHCGGCL